MPESAGKLMAIADRLPHEYMFLKQSYLFKNKSINCKTSELHAEYSDYCRSNEYKPMSIIKFNAKLKEINIDHHKVQGYSRYKLSWDEIKALAKKGKWVHELDDFDMDDENIESDKKNDIIPVELNQDLINKCKFQEEELKIKDNKISKLMEELENLKKQIAQNNEPNKTTKKIVNKTKPKSMLNIVSDPFD